MQAAKDDVRALLERLPDDCSFEDIQYHLYVVEKIRGSLDRVEQGNVLEQSEVEKRFQRWFSV